MIWQSTTLMTIIDLALIALIVFVEIYILQDVEELQAREGDLAPMDVAVGLILVALVLEATRRAVGWTMVIITGFFIVQTLFTDHFFGFFFGPPTSLERFIDIQFVRTDGIFGIPILVVSTYILLFILFGSILIRSGAGQFFIDLAVALTGHRTGGPAKAAVVASALLGTVSGSATANVVTTGSFTIPMMSRLGYRARFAAAVEACASSGGQITPPIMGAAAFIIAEFMRVSYLWVVVAAIVPAMLYFATIYFMVHLEAEKHGIARVPRDELPRLGAVLRRGWHLLLSLVVLITFLVIGFTPMMAAFWAIWALLALSFVSPSTRMSALDMFAVYYGVVSTITPPVALASFAAAAIAGSPPMATAGESARIGATKYLVPFVFVYNPSLLFVGPLWLTAYSTLAALIGVWGLSVALEGWLKGLLGGPVRVATGAAAIALMYPPLLSLFGVSGFVVNLIAAGFMAALFVARTRIAQAAAAEGAP